MSALVSITLGLSEIFVFDPPYLYLVLNTIFWASVASTIIFISAKSFLRQDSLSILLISSGVLILAANFLVIGAVLPFSANAAITLGGILFLFGSIVQVVASFVTFNRIDQTNVTDRKKLLILSYVGILGLTGLISILALANVFPPFFTVSGPTLIRQVGLTLSGSFFGLSSIIFGAAYLRSKTPTLLWYALAMGLICIGAFSTLGTQVVGDIPTWSTRIAYYIGSIYIIIAVFKTRAATISIYDGWADAFVGNRQQIDALFSKMLNGFAHYRIIVDKNGNPIDYVFISANLQFENLTGLKRERIIGKKVTEVLPGIEMDKVDWIGTYGRVALTGMPIQFESYSELLKKWYSISAYSPKKMEFITIFEDITERKKAEEALSKANSQYELLFNSVTEGFANYKIVFDETGKLDLLVLDINPAGAEQSGVKREEQIGKTWRQIWQDIPEELFDVYRQVYETGKSKTFEHFSPITKAWYIVTVNKSADDQFAVTFFNITQRKKAEKEIQSLARFPFENPDVVIRVNSGMKILYSNPASEHLAKSAELKVNDNIPRQWEDYVRKALAANIHVQFEEDFDEKMFLFRVIPIASEGYANVYGTDITERKEAEIELLETKEQTELERKRLETILATTPSAVVILQASDGKITYINKRAMQLYGFNTTGLDLDANVSKVKARYPDGKLYNVKDVPANRALIGQEVHNEEMIIERTDGTTFPILANAAPILDSQGKVTAAVVLFEDITIYKKAEEELKESEQLYRTIFDNSQDGFQLTKVIYDENGKPVDCLFLKVNAAYEHQSGIKAEDIVGKTARQFAPNTEQFWFDLFAEVAKTGKTKHVENYNEPTKRWYDFYVFPYSKDTVGSLLRDITDHKNLEKQLQASERLATIGATAGMVGHDIRNPLQAIVSDVYLLKDYLKDMPEMSTKNDVTESLDGIEQNVDYINKIVLDLQDFVKPLKPVIEEVNIESLVKTSLSNGKVPRNIKTSYHIDKNVKKIFTDPDLLKRVLNNLGTNAIQAMPNGGKMIVTVTKKNEDAIIIVEDSGIGIPDEVKPKLFTPMVTTKSKGQGFGLAVVKRLTEALGGTVSFESEEGKGTKFIIRLPAQQH